MAEKLSVQIALEGGAEVEQQLAGIGKAGQKAFADIEQAALKAGGFRNLKPEEVTNKLKTLGVTGTESINKIQAAVQTAARFENLVLGVRNVEAALAAVGRAAAVAGIALGAVGVAAAAGIAFAYKQTVGFAQAINKTSAEAIKLGTSFEKFDQMSLGLEKAGVSSKAVAPGLQKLQGVLDKLNVDKVKKAFEDLSQLGKTAFPGSNKLAFLVEQAKGVGPAADLAREALQKLGLVDPFKPLSASMGPVQLALKELGLTLETFSGKTLTLDDLLPQIVEKLRQMPDGAARSKLAISLLGDQLGVELIQALRTGGVAIDQFIQKTGGLTTDQENKANELQQSLNRLESAWARFGSVTFAPPITTGINTIITALDALQAAITNLSWKTLEDAFFASWNLIYNAISAFTLQGMLSWIAQAVIAWTGLGNLVKRVFDSMKGSGTPALSDTGDVSGGMAGGGLLGGRGTGTSDSNLAWVSRGEHIMPARAVAQPGVLAFLEALRRSGGNLSRVLNGMGRFALGGMVPRMPAYAAGGLAGGSNVTIQFPGLPPIGGLRASSDVVDQLHRAAALAQVRSGGRKPSRYS